jgi:hypothetical protein
MRFGLLAATPESERGDWEGVVTDGELGVVENGGVDEGNRYETREELRGSVLQLRRKKEHVRRCPDQATDDEQGRGVLSLADGSVVIRGGGRRSGARAAKTRVNGA